jgi:hypothetical protein
LHILVEKPRRSTNAPAFFASVCKPIQQKRMFTIPICVFSLKPRKNLEVSPCVRRFIRAGVQIVNGGGAEKNNRADRS